MKTNVPKLYQMLNKVNNQVILKKMEIDYSSREDKHENIQNIHLSKYTKKEQE